MHSFKEIVTEDKELLSEFFIYLCNVLDTIQFRYGSYNSTRPKHWYNAQCKDLLYNFFSPLVKEKTSDFSFLKWFVLYARSVKNEYSHYAENLVLCKQLIEQSEYKEKPLVSYYFAIQIQQLYFAVHELPIGYLGSADPYDDLDLINDLRQMLSICYSDDSSSVHKEHSSVLSDVEGTIKELLKQAN